MSEAKYGVPECIREKCSQAKYSRWLHAKATTHVKRDRKRLNSGCTVKQYKQAIHAAVTAGGNLDYYTGEELDWSLVSTFDNAAAMEGRTKYKKSFALLPTLDHAEDAHGRIKFVICSWRVNDMKSDMSQAEFYELCDRVLGHHNERQGVSGTGGTLCLS